MLRLPWGKRQVVLPGMYDICITHKDVFKPEAATVLAALELKHLGSCMFETYLWSQWYVSLSVPEKKENSLRFCDKSSFPLIS